MRPSDLFLRIQVHIEETLFAAFPDPETAGAAKAKISDQLNEVTSLVLEDLEALTDRDAAARADLAYVYDSYASFQSVLAYRVANLVHRLADDVSESRETVRQFVSAARVISEQSKVRTGVEIHPAARIGRRFVIDHGHGTVIGEQVEIGDDCYFLQAVTLGGRSVGGSRANGHARRHPRIGNRVEIAGGVGVFGAVTVGDDCRLDSGVRVTTDIPPGSHVRLISTVQVTVAGRHTEIHGVITIPGGILLAGAWLDDLRPALLDTDCQVLRYLRVTFSDSARICCAMPTELGVRAWAIGLFDREELVCFVANVGALSRPSSRARTPGR